MITVTNDNQTIIPQQLQNDSFRFVKLPKKGKIAFETEWQKKNYSYKEIQPWIVQGNNYGVLGGQGGLIIIDCDNSVTSEAMQTAIFNDMLPDTFTVKSGSGRGNHFYYICPEIDKKIKLNGEHSGEILSNGQYAVAPNCIHPDGGTYEVISDIPIASIQREQLQEALKDFWPSESQKTLVIPDEEFKASEIGADQIIKALEYIDPDCEYATWLNVIMAIHSKFPDNLGLVIAVTWSRKGKKFKDGECERIWDSLKRSGITLGTLFHYAEQNGFVLSEYKPKLIFFYSVPVNDFQCLLSNYSILERGIAITFINSYFINNGNLEEIEREFTRNFLKGKKQLKGYEEIKKKVLEFAKDLMSKARTNKNNAQIKAYKTNAQRAHNDR